jgi:pyridoxamine 5'-phosphate oxidase
MAVEGADGAPVHPGGAGGPLDGATPATAPGFVGEVLPAPADVAAALRAGGRHAGWDPARSLLEADVDPDPLVQVRRWLDEARRAGSPWFNAMVLATIGPSGDPSARAVLLKGVDHGFVFFTNGESRKARDMAADGRVAAVLLLEPFERQVRVEGVAAPVADAESDDYWATRPRGSQLGAWASPQSAPLADRAELEARAAAAAARFAEEPIPRPPGWGGWRIAPSSVELWQGRPDRLHDRLVYSRVGDRWELGRLAP